MNRPRVLGVIPARGGSKRLPRKNIMMLAGKPLIAWTIEAAAGARTLTDWLVTTEDDEILEVARKWGAPVPFKRPDELAGDKVRNIDTVMHAMEFMERATGKPYDIMVLLQPTCPIRDPGRIDEAVTRLWESDLDTAVSVKGPYKKRDPILKAVRDGVLEDYHPIADPAEVEPFYMYNASIYAMKRPWFVRERKHISPRQVPIFMDEYHSTDIDTEADFLKAEAYIEHLRKKGSE
jgi:CMP-N-acetylneuraminic acid synthetase